MVDSHGVPRGTQGNSAAPLILPDSHWPKVEAVAAALLEFDPLTVLEVSLICDALDEGEDWRQELANLREAEGHHKQLGK